MWEAIQLEMERRKAFTERYGISKICAFITFIQSILDFHIFQEQINTINSNEFIVRIIFAIIVVGQFISFVLIYSLLPYLFSYLTSFWRKDHIVNVEDIKKCLYSSYLVSVIHILVSILLIIMEISINIVFYRLIYMSIIAAIANIIFFILLKRQKILASKAIISTVMFLMYFLQSLLVVGGEII